ncbi:two-partner secretion domain-containing protein [Phormidesmis sp. 146-33]
MVIKSWFSQCWQWKIGRRIAFVGTLLVGISQSSLAQIVPDNTLGSESSTVAPDVNIRGVISGSSAVAEGIRIEGGAIRGGNLFHSFSQFNIESGRGAYFANPIGIQNILSRVTGANRSEILGRLGVLGDANLFLINPNGIVFGADSSLDVRGSFLATTANAVRLGDAGLFSASQPTESNLLSVSPSAFWFNAVAAQPIVNRSRSQSSFNQPNSLDQAPGLQVRPNRTLALIGGDVQLDGGRLTTAGGQIELGSVAGAGSMSLTQSNSRFLLGYDAIQNFGTIALSNEAFIDASGEGSGDIQIRGARLDMTQGSKIRSDTLGAQNGGEMRIRTSETTLREGSFLASEVSFFGTGTGGTITIDTERLLMSGGGQISTLTYAIARGTGKGGNLQISASELIEVGESSVTDPNALLLSATVFAADAGDIRINTKRLIVRDGSLIVTSANGEGKGGNLQINASESVEVVGESTSSFSRLSTEGFIGDAGDLRINTGRLVVRDGARVSASTLFTGKGGNLQINASESVEVSGRSAFYGDGSILEARSDGAISGGGIGDAGTLKVDTGRLVVRDGAVISSSSSGNGRAGNVDITARIGLQAINGTIETRSSRSAGGTITINAGTIQLFRNSDIRSDVASGADNGGDITLTANSIVAFNDSDILAFARSGRGGNITLNTPAFFGENYRPAPAGTNLNTLDNNHQVDVNATGAVSGIITIPDVSFIQNSLTELPDTQINTDTLLATSCIVRRNQATQGSFTITGSGGLPQRPGEAQASSFPIVDVETLPVDGKPTSSNRPWRKGDPIVESQGVYWLPSGKLILSRNCP